MYSIYKATNTSNGKSYIGKDVHWPRRKSTHKYSASHRNTRDYDSYFHRAVRKYGWDGFKWEILAMVPTNEEAVTLEQKFISEFKTNDRKAGYNLTLGGEGAPGRIITDHTRKKMGRPGVPKPSITISNKQRRWVYHPETHREVMTNLNKIDEFLSAGYLPGRLPGKIHNAEHKAKISEGLKRAYQTGKRMVKNG